MLREKLLICVFLSTSCLCAMPVDKHLDPNKNIQKDDVIFEKEKDTDFLLVGDMDFFDVEDELCELGTESSDDFDTYAQEMTRSSVMFKQEQMLQVPGWVQNWSLTLATRYFALKRYVSNLLG